MRVETVSLHADNGGCARDEVALVRAAQSGDVAAWSELYRVHRPRVFAVCLDHVRTREIAEELTQDVFERAWRQVGGFDGWRIGPWLRTIAANRSRDWLRRQEVERRHLRVDRSQPAAAGPEHDLLRKEGLGELEAALRQLTDRDRLLLWQRYVEDRSVPWLAAAHGLTRRSMEVALRRARSRLREHVETLRLTAMPPILAVRLRVRQSIDRVDAAIGWQVLASPFLAALSVAVVLGTGPRMADPSPVVEPNQGLFSVAMSSPVTGGSPTAFPAAPASLSTRTPGHPPSPPASQLPADDGAGLNPHVPGTSIKVWTEPYVEPPSWRLAVTTPRPDGQDGSVYITGHGDSTSVSTIREVCKDGIEVLVVSCKLEEESE